MCHGLNCDHDFELMKRIEIQLQKAGFATLAFDFNGHGKSEGRFSEMTIPNEIEDLEQVLAYAQDLRFVDDIALVGHSQGAVVAAMVAGNHPEDIKAVTLLAPSSSVRDDIARGNLFGIDFNPLDPPDSLVLSNGIAIGRRYLKTALYLPIFETSASCPSPAVSGSTSFGTAANTTNWSTTTTTSRTAFTGRWTSPRSI